MTFPFSRALITSFNHRLVAGIIWIKKDNNDKNLRFYNGIRHGRVYDGIGFRKQRPVIAGTSQGAYRLPGWMKMEMFLRLAAR